MARNSTLRRRKSLFGSKSGRRSGKGMPLGTVSLSAFITFALVLVVSVFLAQIDTQLKLNYLSYQQTSTHARAVATRLSHQVAPYRAALQVISQHPDVIDAIRGGDSVKMKGVLTQFMRIMPGITELRLFRGNKINLDNKVVPAISYACIDLFNAAKNDLASPMELHAANSQHEHIDMVHVVVVDGIVTGYVQMVLDAKLLGKWINNIVQNDYLEVFQFVDDKKQVRIAAAGNKDVKSRRFDSAKTPVDNSNWEVKTWQPEGISFITFNIGVFSVIAVALILAGCIVWLLKRSLSNAMQGDIESLVGHTVAMVRGQKDHAFAMRMREFRRAAIRVEDMLTNRGLERERDDDPSSANITYDKIQFKPDNAVEDIMDMEVEELDHSEYAPEHFNNSNESSKSMKLSESQHRILNPIANEADAPALPPPEIFKAYDIRGIVGRTLTAPHATLIGKALGSEAKKRGLDKIAFARDGRLSGPELGQALVQGIVSTGVSVVDVGMMPTPVLYYAAAELTNGTGVMLTGSHNPPDYNGFKMVLGGETLASEAIQDLRKRIENEDFEKGKGSYEKASIAEQYVKRILGDVKLKRKLRIVVDCGNGVAGRIAPKLFRAMGCDVTELYCDVDGTFPNHHPDPSKPENLRDLVEMVKSKRYDVGFAFDGDGDRLGVVSPSGDVIWPDRLMMLFAEDVLSRNHGAQIIYDIKCSSNLTRAIWEKGGEPLMWKTGHSLIKAKMKQSGALLAGEMSGHIFFKERWYGFDDGLYSGARLLEILSKDTRTPQQVFDSLPDAVNTPELNIKMAEGEHHVFIEKFMSSAEFGDANVTMIDGIRVDYEDAWGLVRASNTTPVLVLRFEGNNPDALKRVQDEFRKQLLALEPGLSLPF